MWLTDIMMILFAGAMASLLVDMGRRYYGGYRQYFSGAVALSAIASSLIIVLAEWVRETPGATVTQPVVSPLATIYVIDSFSMFIIITELFVGLVIAYFSAVYLTPKDNAGPFFALLLIMLLSLTGVSTAGDLLSLFLFWEGMAIAAYGLVSFRRRSRISLEASMKYFFLAGAGSLLALYGISIIYAATGSLRLSALAATSVAGSQTGVLGMLMLVVGFGVEAAIVPLHTWLPDVYSAAPTPVAALISGAVTGTGVFVIVRIVQPGTMLGIYSHPEGYLQSAQLLLVVLAVATMLLGNLSALGQTNLRRMLGYSSISQTGYMLAAISTFSIPGLLAVVFNIWNHSLLKSDFFMLTGRSDNDYSMTEMKNLAGMGGRSRLSAFMYASTSLGMVGSPPFGLFWSELLIVQSLLLMRSTVFTLLAIIVVANIVLSIGYYFRVINSVASVSESPNPPPSPRRREMAAPLALLLVSILTGIVPGLFVSHIAMVGGVLP